MIVPMLAPLALWCGFAVAIAGVAVAQVPMEQEPHHHLAFKNGTLSVFEPSIPPGETTLEHLHPDDDATVCISGSNMRSQHPGADWSNPGQACNPGQINVSEYAGKPSSHTVQNVGSGVFHLVAVENMRESGWSTNLPLSAAATVLAKETRAFQIYEVKLDKNSRGTSHVHSRPTILVLVSGEVTAGKKRLDQPGQWLLISEGKPHALTTQCEAKLVEIEVR
jgi:quercetin dioxygenase-like cupin family protein